MISKVRTVEVNHCCSEHGYNMMKYKKIAFCIIVMLLSLNLLVCCGGGSSVDMRKSDGWYGPTPPPSSGSGGGSDGSDISSNASLQIPGVYIDLDNMLAIYYSHYESNNKIIIIGIPLNHFFPNEVIELGADNFTSANGDNYALANKYQAMVLVLEYDGEVNSIGDSGPRIISAKVSVEGKVVLQETSIAGRGRIIGNINTLKLNSINLSSNEIIQDANALEYYENIAINATVVNEGCFDPLVTSITPNSGSIGTEVTLKGFNFPSGINVGFDGYGCISNFLEDYVSEHELKIVIKGTCNDTHFKIIDAYGGKYITSESFEMEELNVNRIAFPDGYSDIIKTVYNHSSNLLYILFNNSDKLHIYSISEKQFVDALILPGISQSFDVSVDGQYIAVGIGLDVYLSNNSFETYDVIEASGGVEVGDIAFGPELKALVLIAPDSWPNETKLGVVDSTQGTIEYPDELKLTGDFVENMKFLSRYDRRVILAHSDSGGCPKDIEVYQLNAENNFEKAGVKRLSCRPIAVHPIETEIFVGLNLYNYELEWISKFIDFTDNDGPVVSPDGKYIVLFDAYFTNTFDIYDHSNAEKLISSAAFNDTYVDLKVFDQSIITEDNANLILFSDNYLYHVDFQSLIGWKE